MKISSVQLWRFCCIHPTTLKKKCCMLATRTKYVYSNVVFFYIELYGHNMVHTPYLILNILVRWWNVTFRGDQATTRVAGRAPARCCPTCWARRGSPPRRRATTSPPARRYVRHTPHLKGIWHLFIYTKRIYIVYIKYIYSNVMCKVT